MFEDFNFLAAILALAVVVGVMMLLSRSDKQDTVSSRMHQIAKLDASGKEGEDYEEYETYQERSQLSYLLEKVLHTFKIDYQEYERQLKLKFAQSGIDSPNAPIYYIFAKKIGPFIGVALALLLLTSPASGAVKFLYFGLAAYFAYMGLKGADSYLNSRKKKRQYVLQRSFPDGLDLILVCVEAGLALDAALSRVCKELESAHPELTKEFNKTRIELTLLNDRPKALQNLAERTDMVAFRALSGALLQSEKFGTSLTETLRVLSEDYRQTRMMAAENKANRLPALITLPLMMLMMPAFVMLLMGPAIIMLIATWGGV